MTEDPLGFRCWRAPGRGRAGRAARPCEVSPARWPPADIIVDAQPGERGQSLLDAHRRLHPRSRFASPFRPKRATLTPMFRRIPVGTDDLAVVGIVERLTKTPAEGSDDTPNDVLSWHCRPRATRRMMAPPGPVWGKTLVPLADVTLDPRTRPRTGLLLVTQHNCRLVSG